MKLINDKEMLEMLEAGTSQAKIARHFEVSDAAVSKRLKRLQPKPESLNLLTEKEKRFVAAKSQGKSHTQAAKVAFDCTTKDSAKNIGSKLMKNPKVITAVKDLMDYHGMTRDYRVQRLKSHVDSDDPQASLKALDQTWKLDGAYKEEEKQVEFDYNVALMTAKEAAREIKKLEEEMGIGDTIDMVEIDTTEV